MNAQREKEIRDELNVVISHIDADMALDLLEELDKLRDEYHKFRTAAKIFTYQLKESLDKL